MVVLGLVMSVMVLVGVFMATDTVWNSGGDEVEESGNFFSECINEILTDQGTECNLFGDDDNGG